MADESTADWVHRMIAEQEAVLTSTGQVSRNEA